MRTIFTFQGYPGNTTASKKYSNSIQASSTQFGMAEAITLLPYGILSVTQDGTACTNLKQGLLQGILSTIVNNNKPIQFTLNPFTSTLTVSYIKNWGQTEHTTVIKCANFQQTWALWRKIRQETGRNELREQISSIA